MDAMVIVEVVNTTTIARAARRSPREGNGARRDQRL